MLFTDWAVAFFGTWQVRTILGLIVLDVLLGISAALKRKEFQWRGVADFYFSNILPYIVGYGALWLAIRVIIPPSAGVLSETLVTVAWGALTSSLLGSIGVNLTELYGKRPA